MLATYVAVSASILMVFIPKSGSGNVVFDSVDACEIASASASSFATS